MGLDLMVGGTGACRVAVVLERLTAAGVSATVQMVDNQLHAPGQAVPDGWNDVRLRTPAGTITLRRRGDGIAVVVVGNADAGLLAAQAAIAQAVRESK